MFSINQAHCNNRECTVDTFNYASCEPPICPACKICADCGEEEQEHDGSGSCPRTCPECGEDREGSVDEGFVCTNEECEKYNKLGED